MAFLYKSVEATLLSKISSMKNWKGALLLCVALAFSKQASAQWHLGIKGGSNLSEVVQDVSNVQGAYSVPKSGVQAGLVVNYRFNKTFALQTELLFSQKGYMVYRRAEKGQTWILTSDWWSLTNNYLELPVMAQAIYPFKRFSLFANGGVYGAYWTTGYWKGRLVGQGFGGEAQEPYEFDSDWGINRRKDNRWDVGVSLGAGASFKIRKAQIAAEARLGQGLIDLHSFTGEKPLSYSGKTNRVYSFTLSCIYPLSSARANVKKTQKDNSY
jgi:hypothetical protein